MFFQKLYQEGKSFIKQLEEKALEADLARTFKKGIQRFKINQNNLIDDKHVDDKKDRSSS